jgi:hypothetical protein
VFSEPGKIEKLSSFFFDTFKVFKIDLSFLYKYLRPLSFISSIKFLIEVAVTFNNILSKKEKRKLEILELWRIFFIIKKQKTRTRKQRAASAYYPISKIRVHEYYNVWRVA